MDKDFEADSVFAVSEVRAIGRTGEILDQNQQSNMVDTNQESKSALQRQFRERYENWLQQD